MFSHLKSTIESLEADEAIKSGFPCKVADKDLGMIGLKKELKLRKIFHYFFC